MKFLKANWENLIMINYQVSKEVLEKYVPTNTILDDFEGKYYVSLVAFRNSILEYSLLRNLCISSSVSVSACRLELCLSPRF